MPTDLTSSATWLPLFFFVAMGIAVLSYVVLDGYDLGVGLLLNRTADHNKDMMFGMPMRLGLYWGLAFY